jgi:lipopolysaccharide transport protein LptA
LSLGVGIASAQNATPAASATGGAAPAVETSPPSGEVTVQAGVAATPAAAPAATTAAAAATTTAAKSASTQKPHAASPKASPAAAAGQSGGKAKESTKAADQSDSKQPSSPFSAFSSPNSGPINIKSDSLSVDYKKNSAMWRGHVHAIRADGQLDSDTLLVLYGKDFHELQQLIASGNVRISRGTQWSTSDHAVMNQANQTVVLTGNPVVHDSSDQITGSKITVYLKTGESVVEGAKAVIFPRQGKTRDNGASADHAK